MVKSKKYHKEYSKEWRKVDRELADKYQALGMDNTETFSSFKQHYKKHKN